MGSGATFTIAKFGKWAFVDEVAGVKILTKKEKRENEPDSTPRFSHTANTMYARMDDDKKKVVQIAVYRNHEKIKDIEWGHFHKNTDGTTFKKGEVHVQEYVNGQRNRDGRLPTEEEKELARIVKEWHNG